ncbi:MAG: anti-phage dCTP deaminase, partial [Pyrinomonadaceae bacterium]
MFFGLVNPTGTDLDSVIKKLSDQLRAVGYNARVISLSEMIAEYSSGKPKKPGEYGRIKFLMEEGTRLRESTKMGDFVARLALIDIRRKRKTISGDENTPATNTAYILRSFKRKEEVELFRTVYGKTFNLISVYSPVDKRLDSLAKKIAKASKRKPERVKHEAQELITIDAEEEGRELGQNVRDTFPLADYFVSVQDSAKLNEQLARLVQLVFGNPYLTPSRGEHAMFMAQAAALRSGDLSRQVGAAIVSAEGELLAIGCNDVPKFGGGLYWADDPTPKRDIEIGHDSNAKIKQDVLEEVFHKLRHAGWLNAEVKKCSDEELFRKSTLEKDKFLHDTQLLDVIEFGRSLHAEMAALTDAAKRGISVKDSKLFCTTFPCHICARHIVSSGVGEVVYIEPYPKSRTEELYPDSVAVDAKDLVLTRLNFYPFVGAAPRRYFDFF